MGLALVAVAWLAGCRDGGGVERDDSGQVVAAGEESVFELGPGDCIQPPEELSAASIEDLRAVPCSEPHTHEVYAVATYDAGDVYPGANELQAFADRSCLERFEDYVGLPFDESSLRFSYLFPSFPSWNDGDDRDVICLVVSTDEPLTSSAKGLAR